MTKIPVTLQFQLIERRKERKKIVDWLRSTSTMTNGTRILSFEKFVQFIRDKNVGFYNWLFIYIGIKRETIEALTACYRK